MTTPFDHLAASYSSLWSETPAGRAQREQVWKEIDPLFRKGDRILDLGCGTGDDALHLQELGAEVFGIDASRAMVEITKSRGIAARHLLIEDLDVAQAFLPDVSRFVSTFAEEHNSSSARQARMPAPQPEYVAREFDGVISNFGALNCVKDLQAVGRALSRIVAPDAPVALCVLSRFFWHETLDALRSGDLKRATRRWSGETDWRGLKIYYRSTNEMQQALSPHFRLQRLIPIGDGDHQLYIFRGTGDLVACQYPRQATRSPVPQD